MALIDSIKHSQAAPAHRPWPRVTVADAGWKKAIELLAGGRCTLLVAVGRRAACAHGAAR